MQGIIQQKALRGPENRVKEKDAERWREESDRERVDLVQKNIAVKGRAFLLGCRK